MLISVLTERHFVPVRLGSAAGCPYDVIHHLAVVVVVIVIVAVVADHHHAVGRERLGVHSGGVVVAGAAVG